MVDDYYEPTLGDHLRAARRLWPVLAAATVAGLVLGGLVGTRTSDPEYTSDSVISVVDERFVVSSLDLQIAEISTPSATAAMNRALADDVAALAAERAGGSVPVTGVADESAGTFTLTVTGPDPQSAVDRAAIYGTAALEVAADNRGGVLTQTAEALEGRIDELDAELVALRATLAGASGAQAEALRSQLEQTSDRRLEFGDRLAALESFSATTTGGITRVTSASDAVEVSGGLSMPLAILLGGLLGALAGLGIVVVASLADRRIRSRVDAELNARGVPVLGVLGRNDLMTTSPAARALARQLEDPASTVVLVPAGIHAVDPVLATETAKALDQLGSTHEVTVGSIDTLAFEDADQAVVVIAEAGVTTDDELACSVTELSDMGARVLGLVLTGVDPRDLPRAAAGLDSRRDGNDPG